MEISDFKVTANTYSPMISIVIFYDIIDMLVQIMSAGIAKFVAVIVEMFFFISCSVTAAFFPMVGFVI